MKICELKAENDPALADLIRVNLKKYRLDIPGTVYFDENLNHLSDYYLADPAERFYYVMIDDNDRLVGGIGLARFEFFEDCCELQKLYLADEVKGAGLSYKL
ncbi:MAG: N-acetyltransferase, partial [Clostridia bacterium]|nr:N-acetyltransferase [Clostridia bacterium]